MTASCRRGKGFASSASAAIDEVPVFRRKALEEATPELMAENGIPRRGSCKLWAVRQTNPGPAR